MNFEEFKQKMAQEQPQSKSSVERVKEAEDFFQQALEISLQAQSDDLGRTEATYQAVELFVKSLCLNPHHIRAYLNLALILLAQEDYKSALAYINEALKIAPDHAEALNLRQVLSEMYAEDAIDSSEAPLTENTEEQLAALNESMKLELRRVESQISAIRDGNFQPNQSPSDFEQITRSFKLMKSMISQEEQAGLKRSYYKLLAHIQLLNFASQGSEGPE